MRTNLISRGRVADALCIDPNAHVAPSWPDYRCGISVGVGNRTNARGRPSRRSTVVPTDHCAKRFVAQQCDGPGSTIAASQKMIALRWRNLCLASMAYNPLRLLRGFVGIGKIAGMPTKVLMLFWLDELLQCRLVAHGKGRL